MSKIVFNFNKEKAIEVILYLANKRISMDRMSLFKFLFFSDLVHLNKYGRTIVGGHYVAMQLGPVPSQVANLVEKSKKGSFDITDCMITALREPNMNLISQSDKEVMDTIYDKYQYFNPKKLSDISHKNRAWIKAKRKNRFKNNNALDYKDMISPLNKDLIEDLEENSRYIII